MRKIYILLLLIFWAGTFAPTYAQECPNHVISENGPAGEIRMSLIKGPITFFKNKTSASDSLCLVKVVIRGSRATQFFDKLTIYMNKSSALVFDNPKVEYENIQGEHYYSTMVVIKKTQPLELAFYQIGTIELGMFQVVIPVNQRDELQKAAFCTYFNKLPKNI